MQTPVKSTWKSTTGGVLTVVAGVFSLICCLGLIVAVVLVGSSETVSEAVLDYVRDADVSWLDVPLIQTFMIIGAIFFAITATLALIGGISALRRKRWGWALAGSIAAIPGSWWPLGVAAIVFTAISRDEFK
jgi:uncharacterized BrkB/YihY/UPF0761 family membrane protein